MTNREADGSATGHEAHSVSGADPVWLRPADLDGWPVTPRSDRVMRYRIPLHVAWAAMPRTTYEGSAPVHWYDGRTAAEWARVALLPTADPSADLAAWVETAVAVIGFPVPMPALAPSPRLIEWRREATSEALARSAGVDAVLGYTGLATVHDGDWNWLMRLYNLLMRKGMSVWNVTLAFESACPPGMDEQMIAVNDHVRAGATFGDLRLS